MAHPIATRTIAQAPANERVDFLKGVLGLTSVGLMLTGVSGFIAAKVMGPYFFPNDPLDLGFQKNLAASEHNERIG